ncbi:H-NS family nucleoid-associated regulatory protein [Sphingomonas sp.]|uniref:H-NS histone family protein n=1 Tax=Sphingomonas sp. TaxID=28214 RepID=UPI001EC7AAF8|nr:H-NS family nucleoid-associated regulatory protein [Sphingomonas sp.]MBX3595646.1 H-NS histone family protein [Sphingomonas sp.]
MNAPTLDSVLSAKAKLEEELRNLQQQETELRRKAAENAFSEVMRLLGQFCPQFTSKQKAEIAAAAGEKAPSKPKKSAAGEVVPKYWLPHTGETWSGRGRMPRSFAAYEGSAAHKEWMAKNPNDRFPKFPG